EQRQRRERAERERDPPAGAGRAPAADGRDRRERRDRRAQAERQPKRQAALAREDQREARRDLDQRFFAHAGTRLAASAGPVQDGRSRHQHDGQAHDRRRDRAQPAAPGKIAQHQQREQRQHARGLLRKVRRQRGRGGGDGPPARERDQRRQDEDGGEQ